MADEIIIATEWGDFPFPKNTPKSEIIQQMEAIIAQEEGAKAKTQELAQSITQREKGFQTYRRD